MLEQRLEALERRVLQLESKVGVTNPYAFSPPPPIQRPPRFDVPAPVVQGQLVVRKDAEYLFGAQWLPRVGASLLILGIAFLIGLGVSNGWITPLMLFIGCVAISGGFIATGIWARHTREDFGNVLMGIGSCGMFATLVGGHVFQKLYSGEVLVSGFVIWSLANLAYAFAQRSRAFLTIGVVGGLLSAAMPTAEQAFDLSLGLHALILLTAWTIAARHRFSRAAVGIWAASAVSLLPVFFTQAVSNEVKVAAIMVATFGSLWTYLATSREGAPDERRALAIAMITVGALAQYGFGEDAGRSLTTLAYAALAAALSWLFREDFDARTLLGWASLAIATLLAPLGLGAESATFLFAIGAVTAGVVGAIGNRTSGLLSVLYLFAAHGAFGWWWMEGSFATRPGEWGLLIGLVAAGLGCAVGLWRAEEEGLELIPLFAIGAVLTRMAMLLPGQSDLRMMSLSVTAAWALYGATLLAVGFGTNRKILRYMGLGVLSTAVTKVLLIDLATATPELRVAALVALGLILVASGYAYIRKRSDRVA